MARPLLCNGNRVQAVRDGSTTRYIYDASGNLLAEANGDNNITKYFIHGLGLMAMVTPTDQVYTYHFNAIGSTIATSDSTQTMVNKYSYDPFGKVMSQDEQVPQPFKFVGQHGVMTEPNGFYYMRARYYDPEVGRFISEDPIGFEGGINLYAYASNNPILLIDPSGLIAPNIAAALIGGGIGATTGAISTVMSNPNWTWQDVARGAATGGTFGALTGFTFGGSILANTAVGAATGAAGDVAGQAISNYANSRPMFSNLDTDSIGFSAMSGALGGGIGTSLSKIGATAAQATLGSSSIAAGAELGWRNQLYGNGCSR